MIERYYVKVSGTLGCQRAHPTLESAYTEARRLFDLEGPKRRVYVLQVLGVVGDDPPAWKRRAPKTRVAESE